MDTCKLLYNTERVKLYIPEYGRNVQKMVDYLKTIEDRQKRNEQAKAVIRVMEILNLAVHLQENYEQKLWDHLFIISGFDLDVDAPYPMPAPESLQERPMPVPIQKKPVKANHYGRNIESIIDLIALFHSNLAEKMADKNVKTELDWQLYQLQRRYLDYQVNIGNRIIELLSSGDAESQQKAAEVSYPKRRFQDLTDELFSETGKKIIRSKNEIVFDQEGRELLPYRLSSGEKQILVILLTVLVQDKQPCVLLMDEPEISLHIEWQQRIISIIREMNPNAQVILTTHSPAVVMGGWMDAVTEVTDITV